LRLLDRHQAYYVTHSVISYYTCMDHMDVLCLSIPLHI
jgi:hypothetical protein